MYGSENQNKKVNSQLGFSIFSNIDIGNRDLKLFTKINEAKQTIYDLKKVIDKDIVDEFPTINIKQVRRKNGSVRKNLFKIWKTRITNTIQNDLKLHTKKDSIVINYQHKGSMNRNNLLKNNNNNNNNAITTIPTLNNSNSNKSNVYKINTTIPPQNESIKITTSFNFHPSSTIKVKNHLDSSETKDLLSTNSVIKLKSTDNYNKLIYKDSITQRNNAMAFTNNASVLKKNINTSPNNNLLQQDTFTSTGNTNTFNEYYNSSYLMSTHKFTLNSLPNQSEYSSSKSIESIMKTFDNTQKEVMDNYKSLKHKISKVNKKINETAPSHRAILQDIEMVGKHAKTKATGGFFIYAPKKKGEQAKFISSDKEDVLSKYELLNLISIKKSYEEKESLMIKYGLKKIKHEDVNRSEIRSKMNSKVNNLLSSMNESKNRFEDIVTKNMGKNK